MSFRNLSERIISKGLSSEKAISLADLHRRRTDTQSQYFTPQWVAKGIWKSLSSLTNYARSKDKLLHVIDSSCGSGRLFEGAPLDRAVLHGLDIDKRCIDALIKDSSTLDIESDFKIGCIAELDYRNFDIAVINPAYSIHLESPSLTHFDSNSFGRFGAGTAALSHEYALAQAIAGADVVAAVLPLSIDDFARSFSRLMAVVHLPDNTFSEEGANVRTAVYFFSACPSVTVQEFDVTPDYDWPMLSLSLERYKGKVQFKLKTYDETTPTIILPVTGNNRVELHQKNRKITLKFYCGLIQAKVLNGLYQCPATGKRLPKSIQFVGQGALILDVLLLQESPEQQLCNLAKRINDLGGDAWISPTLCNYYKKLVRRHKRAITPLYRMIKATTTTKSLAVKARRRTLLNPHDLNSPGIKKEQILQITPQGGEYCLSLNGYSVTLRRDEVLKRFEFVTQSDVESERDWFVLHEGLNAAFPDLAHMHKKRIQRANIDWLADFQHFSLTEGLISPYGYCGGWEQGSGKARYAIALALLHSGKNLIVVEPGLLPEMVREFKKLKIPRHQWDVLIDGDTPIKKVSVTTYPNLRKGLKIAYDKEYQHRGEVQTKRVTKTVKTNAQRWRRQFNTVICDEGSLLSNTDTQQTRAVKTLSARKLIVLDGTPQRNYPRNLLALSAASAGNGLSHQPYGVKGKPALIPAMIDSCNHVQRGEDAFYDNHVVTQWVTNEFKEDLQSGGKREVPKINNLGLFRKWLSPNIQRRLRSEPDLAEFANCPTPIRTIKVAEWDKDHLGYYLKTALEFAHWYKRNKENSKALNMVTILARIQAVQRAANSPHVFTEASESSFAPITSKQRLAIARIKHYISIGRKVILYATSPEVLERLHYELAQLGVRSVLYTGKQNIEKRAIELDRQFRFGKTQVMLSSWVGQRGLNLEQATAVILYERNPSATTEEQAISRTQRPTQLEQVSVEYLHLKGSIDEYWAQLVDWKLKSSEAGLDYGEQSGDDEEFLHLDTIMSRFCEEVLSMSAYEAKNRLFACA